MGQRETRLIVIPGILKAHCYDNEVLNIEAIPFLRRHGPGTWQQGNARPHTDALTHSHFAANNIAFFNWPALSPRHESHPAGT